MMWILDIFGEHENPYVIRLCSKFHPDPNDGFRDMAILLHKTNFWRVVESSHPREG
jgi:hypothetical protein